MIFYSPPSTGGGGGASSLTPASLSAYPGSVSFGTFTTCTGAGGRVNLPAGSSVGDVRELAIANQTSGSLSVYGNGSDTVNGDAYLTVTAQDAAIALYWTGSGWLAY